MTESDDDFSPDDNEIAETPQQTKKSKVHVHSTLVKNKATGTHKLKCN